MCENHNKFVHLRYFSSNKYFSSFIANHNDASEPSFPVFYQHPSPKFTNVSATFNYTCKARLPGQLNQTKDNEIKYQWRRIEYVRIRIFSNIFQIFNRQNTFKHRGRLAYRQILSDKVFLLVFVGQNFITKRF